MDQPTIIIKHFKFQITRMIGKLETVSPIPESWLFIETLRENLCDFVPVYGICRMSNFVVEGAGYENVKKHGNCSQLSCTTLGKGRWIFLSW